MEDITKHEHGLPDNPRVAHEKGDADVFAVTKYGIGLGISVIVVAMMMWGLFDLLYLREQRKSEVSPVPARVLNERPKLPPAPRLQATPKIEIRELREDEAKILDSFGWIDPDKGIVRIPIDRAIEAVAKKGLPTKPGVVSNER